MSIWVGSTLTYLPIVSAPIVIITSDCGPIVQSNYAQHCTKEELSCLLDVHHHTTPLLVFFWWPLFADFFSCIPVFQYPGVGKVGKVSSILHQELTGNIYSSESVQGLFQPKHHWVVFAYTLVHLQWTLVSDYDYLWHTAEHGQNWQLGLRLHPLCS